MTLEALPPLTADEVRAAARALVAAGLALEGFARAGEGGDMLGVRAAWQVAQPALIQVREVLDAGKFSQRLAEVLVTALGPLPAR